MKVVFISPTQYYGQYHFTQNKVYDVTDEVHFKMIESDNGLKYNINWYSVNKFIPLEEWREFKLNKVLNLIKY